MSSETQSNQALACSTGQTTCLQQPSSPKVALGILAALALAKVAVHLPSHSAYGYFRDELYYLDCAKHLAWGYVDHPPLSIAILALTSKLLGTSLLAIRMPAVLAGATTVFFAGLVTWRLGGGRFAQALAALSVLVAPVYLGVGSFFSMNAFDQFFWTLAVYALVRAITTSEPRSWLWFGLVAGLGLLNKVSVAFLGFGVVVGLLLTHHRRFFATKELWLGGLIAFAVFLPHLWWQWRNDWPTPEFIRNATQHKILAKSISDYFLGQLVDMHPIVAPIWIGGIIYGLLGRSVKAFRILSIVFIAVFALLALRGGKVYYLSPAFPPVLALGALWAERATAAHRWIRFPGLTIVALLGIAVAPMALPILSPEAYPRYTQSLHLSAPAEEHADEGIPIPQFLADRFGWAEMVEMVAQAYHALDPDDRTRCAILCGNYGEAGAINFFGPKFGLPQAISEHNNYFIWGTRGATGEVMLIYSNHFDRSRLASLFESVSEVGRFTHPNVMPHQSNRSLFLCRGLRKPMEQFWRSIKSFG